MSRGVSFERVLEFFDNAPLRVAQAAVSAGLGIVGKREEAQAQDAKRQAAGVQRTLVRKPRRTKAQIAADNASKGTNGSSETLADA